MISWSIGPQKIGSNDNWDAPNVPPQLFFCENRKLKPSGDFHSCDSGNINSAGTTDKNRTSLLGKEDRKQCRLKIKTTTPTGLEHHQHLLPQEHNTPRSINIYFPSLAAWSARSSPGFAVPQIRVFRNRIGLCETDSQRKKSLPLP